MLTFKVMVMNAAELLLSNNKIQYDVAQCNTQQ